MLVYWLSDNQFYPLGEQDSWWLFQKGVAIYFRFNHQQADSAP